MELFSKSDLLNPFEASITIRLITIAELCISFDFFNPSVQSPKDIRIRFARVS